MRGELFWPQKVSKVYHTVCNCETYARIHERIARNRHLQLLPASESLVSNATDMLDPLLRMKNGNVYDIVMTDRYLKITREISTPRTAVTHVANVVLYDCILPTDIPDHLLSKNGAQFVCKFLATL